MSDKVVDYGKAMVLKRLQEWGEARHLELEAMAPTGPCISIAIVGFAVPIDTWLLRKLDQEVTRRDDFIEITDAHYDRTGLYIEYDSLKGEDYDDLLEYLLEQFNAKN